MKYSKCIFYIQHRTSV